MLFIKNKNNIFIPAGIEVSDHTINALKFILGRESKDAITQIGEHTLVDVSHPAFERLFERMMEVERKKKLGSQTPEIILPSNMTQVEDSTLKFQRRCREMREGMPGAWIKMRISPEEDDER